MGEILAAIIVFGLIGALIFALGKWWPERWKGRGLLFMSFDELRERMRRPPR
jgi:hypothetical protein